MVGARPVTQASSVGPSREIDLNVGSAEEADVTAERTNSALASDDRVRSYFHSSRSWTSCLGHLRPKMEVVPTISAFSSSGHSLGTDRKT